MVYGKIKFSRDYQPSTKKRYTYMIPHKQLSLAEVFDDCQNIFDNNKYQFLQLLDESINLDEIVPDTSKFSRFKQDFLMDLNLCSIGFLTWPNRYVNVLTMYNLPCYSLTLPVLRHRLQKTILSMPTALSNNLKLSKRQMTRMMPTPLIKPLIVPCLPRHLQILPFSRCTLTDIFVMPINLASSQTYLALSEILDFVTKTFLKHILKSWLKRNLILRMKINVLQIPKHSFPHLRISLGSIHLSSRKPFWGMPHLILFYRNL